MSMSLIRLRSILEVTVPILLLGIAWLYFSSAEKNTSSSHDIKIESEFKGELTVHIPKKTSPGFTLYPVVGIAKVFLLNMSGEVLHSWELDADRARLLPNGNLLVVHGTKWGMRVDPWKKLKFTVREYSWDGKLIWEYKSPNRVHHDAQRLPSGNTLFPARRVLSPEYHALITNKKRKRIEQIRTDSIYEVTPTGEITWEWKAEEHLDINSCGKAGCTNENPADWTHINTTTLIPSNKWFDNGDKRFRPGNVLSVLRNWWQLILIDRESDEIVWEYEGDYKGGLSGGHDAYMIPKPLPGAGNILAFDNGRYTHQGESYVLEINPLTKEVVWVYDVGKAFHSNSAGSMQRLPNGNTLISEDLTGRTFEVTKEKEIVWEYKGNFRTARSHRYPADFAPQLDKLNLN